MSFNPKQTYLIIHQRVKYALQASQLQLDFKRTAELEPIIQNQKRQLWLLQDSIEGTFNIVNAFTDYLLTEEEEKLFLASKASNQDQTWVLQFVSEHQFLIKLSKQKSKYLCLRNGYLVIFQCLSPVNPDIWVLKPIVDNLKLNNSCFIASTDSLRVMDVTQDSRDQGSIISLKQSNFHYTQRWNIYKAGEIYVIKSLFTQMNLDIFQERFSAQNDVVLWPSNGKISQFWYLQKLYGSTYRISTFLNPQFQLGHIYGKLIIHKGHIYTWIIEGHIPS